MKLLEFVHKRRRYPFNWDGETGMETQLPRDIQAGLDAARLDARRRKARLRIDVGGRIVPVIEMNNSGFTVVAEDAPHLRGLVDLFDGARHLFQCLVVAGDEVDGEMRYEFKRATAVANRAALDFEQRVDAPVGLISDHR